MSLEPRISPRGLSTDTGWTFERQRRRGELKRIYRAFLLLPMTPVSFVYASQVVGHYVVMFVFKATLAL